MNCYSPGDGASYRSPRRTTIGAALPAQQGHSDLQVGRTRRPRLLGLPRPVRPLPRLPPIVALSLTVAGDDSDGPESVAQVRILRASQGRAAVEFRADGTTRGAGQAYGANWSNNRTTAGTTTVVLDIDTLTIPSRSVRSIDVLQTDAGGAPLQSVTALEKN